MNAAFQGPQRIVCLTEETTEWLYLLGESQRVVGISGYTVRPPVARREKPKVSAFLDGKEDRIVALEPDLVIGFSDMQAALADKLIRAGLNVWITNQRSVAEILQTMRTVAHLVGASARGEAWISQCLESHMAMQEAARAWGWRPRVYFEEWDAPMISAIRWVSELIAIAGGDDIFPELAQQSLGRHRVIADSSAVIARNPEVIVASWCGKKFRAQHLHARPGWGAIEALQQGALHEIKSCDILQPGPAALSDGLRQLHSIFAAAAARRAACKLGELADRGASGGDGATAERLSGA